MNINLFNIFDEVIRFFFFAGKSLSRAHDDDEKDKQHLIDGSGRVAYAEIYTLDEPLFY